jgi:hypothetical protein
MPKAGRYDFPMIALDDTIERLRKIVDVSKANVIKRDQAAEILGMKHRGGWTGSLFGAMAQWGLVDTGENQLRVTELARKILYGEPNEVNEAKTEAVKRIEIFADIFQQYGDTITDEQLRTFLRQKAFVDISEVQSLANEVGKIYKKVAMYLRPVAQVPKAEVPKLSVENGESILLEIRSPEYGILKVKDELSAEFAGKIIEVVKTRLKDRKEGVDRQNKQS